ncbi:MAG: arginine--tRNA ligase [Candidatus Nanohaloarchaeota archaeon QJJ-9]|nr:arginine--tRNA ligase [Candidatus Nanohaloarchaeota archaeon QJJ-9]
MYNAKEEIAEELEKFFGIDVSLNDIEIPEPEHGDFAYPAMKAAAELGRNPRELAEEAVEALEEKLDVDRIEVAGPGYVNFYLDRSKFVKNILEHTRDLGFDSREEKVVVEHTSPNPNKPLHMGTMRCAVLGDTIARISDFLGYDVEVQDYINDLGRQSARSVYAYRNFFEELPEEDRSKKADFWVGQLYSKAGQHIEENPSEEEKVSEIIQEIEKGGNDTAELKDELVGKSLRGQLETAYRSNVFYDLLIFEKDVVASDLLDKAMDKLKRLDEVYEVEEGEDKGCLVINLSKFESELGEMKKPYKILLRSDGTATYTAKDIAFTMWKFGLLNHEFGYKKFDEQPSGDCLWSTGGEEEKSFGDAGKVINVVGAPQKFPMKVIKYSLKALGYEEAAEKFSHMHFKFVYLPGKVAYSGRKGNWVGKHGDAVLEKARELALEEIQDRYDFDEDKEEEIAEKVGTAAVRYFLLKYTREKDIDFSFEKALDWEGDSGPYLLYSVARAYGIEEKADVEPEFTRYEHEVEYELAREIERFESVVERSFEAEEPAKLCYYLKEMAETFNSFYHKCPVKGADDEALASSRMALVHGYINVMEEGLSLLGIESLEEM